MIGENFEDEDTLKEFEKDDEISIIITCKKISMGYDYPRIDMVVFADSKCQKIDIAQCIGRGLRTIICNPNKVCHVLLPVNEKELSKAKYETIRGFFEYMREECEYEILSRKSWELNPKPSPKPSPIPGPPIIDKDDYGLQIECDFKDNSLKTKILSMYSINKTTYITYIKLTPDNAKKYIGYDVSFNSRKINYIKKIIKVSESGKSITIDHPDLQNSLQIVSRDTYALIYNNTDKYTLSTQLEKIKSNNILSYSEYEVFYKKSKESGLYTVDELKAEKRFYWKLVDSNQKYYKNQKQCEKEIKKLDKTFELNEINSVKFVGYHNSNPKIPPMSLKEYYGIYCRDMRECFLHKQKVRHVIKNINGKNHIWEGIYEKDKNIIVCNDENYKSKSPLNLFAKSHIKNVKPNRTNVTVNAWEYCEYYCNKEEQWITTMYMNPI